jgi:EAL domain-containing protein (putative c-di-GMP-specific phosphodiesterase class I)
MSSTEQVSWVNRSGRTLREEREVLDVLLDSLDVAVVACGRDGQLTHLNRRAIELMGMDGSTGSAPGTWTAQVFPRTPDGIPLELEQLPIIRALRGEVVPSVDLLIQTSRGDVLMSTTAKPIWIDDNVQVGAIAVFADVTAQRQREAEIREELRAANLAVDVQDAIVGGHVTLYAQPIIDLSNGDTVLEELLMRVRSRDGAFVSPAAFLDVAEHYGVVSSVDEWVFHQAVRIAGPGRPVAINVSARTVGRLSFLDVIERTLDRRGMDPSLITFEITETAVISDIVRATRFTDRLETIGCRFALDDFGTGYAPFTYLKHLPVRYLKIDIEFVRDLVHSERSRAVVTGMIGLARGLGQLTIAEGVEDAETLALLRELGVDLAQGFHIGRPAPVDRTPSAPARLR